jgi:hypothetical protein
MCGTVDGPEGQGQGQGYFCACVCVCVCVCVRMYVCVCVCVCLYMYVCTYILRPNSTTHAIYFVLAAVIASWFCDLKTLLYE